VADCSCAYRFTASGTKRWLEVNQLVAAFLAEKHSTLATAYATRWEQKIKEFLFNGTK
jgi:hypothetical protein